MWQAPRQKVLDLKTRQQYLQRMQCWRASGRIATTWDSQTVNASFNWQQNKSKYHIHFFSPFSTQSLTIHGDNLGFSVITTDASTTNDLELEKRLPFAQLSYWVKGMIYPHSSPAKVEYDGQNQVKILQQDGWLIEFQSYDHSHPVSLPEKLKITDGHFGAKLVLKNWQN